MGVSIDYNQPAKLDQLKRMNEDKLRLCFNSIMWSNNLVDISRVKGNDLHIEDTEMFTYLLTYSFPCQDLSLAGKGAGMEKGSGTRSGLLWEVERILSECKNKPQILLMENVTQVHGAGNENHFKQWLLRLEEFGYQSYWEDMSAVDFGIPQTRNRTFMISILGDYNYSFPKKTELKLRLKDLLESDVDEKYYLSQAMIDYVTGVNQKDSNFPRGERFKKQLKITNEKSIAVTISTNAGNRPVDNFIVDNNDDIKVIDSYNKKLTDPNVSGCVVTRQGSNQGSMIVEKPKLKIKNATKTGYLEATIGDGVDISSRMESHRGTVQKGMAQTITTMGGENVGVVVSKENLKSKMAKELIESGKVQEYDVIRHSYTNSRIKGEMKDMHQNNISPTLDTRCDCLGIVVSIKENNYSEKSIEKILNNIVEEEGVSGSLTATGMQSINHDGCQLISLKRGYDVKVKPEQKNPSKIDVLGSYSKLNYNQTSIVGKNGLSPIVTENHGEVTAIYNNLRIRKLTPKECFRLMGLKDEDIDLVMENQSNASAYHLAGDSIVTTCLMAILGQLFDIDWKTKFNPDEWWKK